MEEVLYDTSVVIRIIAKNRKRIQGYTSIFTVIEYPPTLSYASKILYPEKKDYHLAVKWQTILRRKGNPIPAVDLIIAAQAYNRNLRSSNRNKGSLEVDLSDLNLFVYYDYLCVLYFISAFSFGRE